MNRFNPLYYLLFQSRRTMRLVNFITFFRVLAFPVLIFLLITDRVHIFKWLLVACFLTDAVDGYLARKFKVASILGSRLDSISDDLTVLAAIIGLFYVHPIFLLEEWLVFAIPLSFFFIQTIYALSKYRKTTSFHTYLAKTAAVFQGVFLCAMFFFDQPVYWLFYATSILTTIELIEEIVIVALLPVARENVKGIYWVLRERKNF